MRVEEDIPDEGGVPSLEADTAVLRLEEDIPSEGGVPRFEIDQRSEVRLEEQ